MTDTKLLTKKIADSGLKRVFIAKKMGLSAYGLAKKINNENEFKVGEIKTLCDILKIKSFEEVNSIFFTPKVDLKSTVATNKRVYHIWRLMVERCTNPEISTWANYGGRGIRVCDEWREDPFAFYEWAMANGYSDDLSIDRIDSNGNYEPSNCRWTTMKEQQNNRRNNKRSEP